MCWKQLVSCIDRWISSNHNKWVKLAQTNLVSVNFETNTVLQVSCFDGSILYWVLEWGNSSRKKEALKKNRNGMKRRRKDKWIKRQTKGSIALYLLVTTSIQHANDRGAASSAAWHWLKVTMEIRPVGGECVCVCVCVRRCLCVLPGLQGPHLCPPGYQC